MSQSESQDKNTVNIPHQNVVQNNKDTIRDADAGTSYTTTSFTKVPSVDSIKRKTMKDMKDLGVHKPQFNRLIDIYAGLVHQYLYALAEFEMNGYQYETETAAGGTKKSSIVSTMENLRKDILQYSDRLCLNPKSLGSITPETGETSKLDSVLSRLG